MILLLRVSIASCELDLICLGFNHIKNYKFELRFSIFFVNFVSLTHIHTTRFEPKSWVDRFWTWPKLTKFPTYCLYLYQGVCVPISHLADWYKKSKQVLVSVVIYSTSLRIHNQTSPFCFFFFVFRNSQKLDSLIYSTTINTVSNFGPDSQAWFKKFFEPDFKLTLDSNWAIKTQIELFRIEKSTSELTWSNWQS